MIEIDFNTLMLVRVFLGLALSVALTLGICELFGFARRSGRERARE